MGVAGQNQGVIDTDILIDVARGVADAVTFLANQQAAAGLQTTVVSKMESIVGCRDQRELAKLQQFLHSFVVLPISPQGSWSAVQLIEAFRLSHGLLIPDALIAAIALEHGATLYTKNVRHFQMVPALTVVRPY